MKPKKRVMCPECWKPKMQFETKEKALSFIKFNGDSIDAHGGKLRCYYCESCGCYHITSKFYSKKFEGRTEKLIEAYKRDKKAIADEREKTDAHQKKLNKVINKIYNGFMRNTTVGKFSKYIELYCKGVKDEDREVIIKRLKKRREIETSEYWQSLTDEEKNSILDKIVLRSKSLNLTKCDEIACMMKIEFKRIPSGCASSVFERLETEVESNI